MKKKKKIKIFSLGKTNDFGQEVCSILNLPLSSHEEKYFEDGECYVAPSADLKDNVRGKDVFVINSMYTDEFEDVNKKIIKTLIFAGALHDASAKRITLVLPYYPYARQDRKTTSRAPITTKYFARIFKKTWVKRILSLDVHNPSVLQNAFPIPIDLLEANFLFASYVSQMIHDYGIKEITVLSPDKGGLERAQKFGNALSYLTKSKINVACLSKQRSGDKVIADSIIENTGNVIFDKWIIIYDDMISSGSTIAECTKAVEGKRAKGVLAVCASHGLFVGNANENLANPFIKNVITTDSVRPFRITNTKVLSKLIQLKTTNLFAEAIRRIHMNESISDLIRHPTLQDSSN